jgi:ADP-ribosylglycohydrolase
MTTRDRFRGLMLGTAVGDALGRIAIGELRGETTSTPNHANP